MSQNFKADVLKIKESPVKVYDIGEKLLERSAMIERLKFVIPNRQGCEGAICSSLTFGY